MPKEKESETLEFKEKFEKEIFDMIGKTGKGTYYIFIQTPHKINTGNVKA